MAEWSMRRRRRRRRVDSCNGVRRCEKIQVGGEKRPPLPNPLLQRRRGRSIAAQFFHSFSVTAEKTRRRQRRGQSSLFSPRKRPPEKSARLTPTLESSLFSPTQTRKKCSTDPDAPPSPTG